MKFALFLATIIASANAVAQQAPDAVRIPERPAAPVPPVEPPKAHQFSNKELTELLRAQTAAIKSLSNKLDSLEERVTKIEKKGR